MQNMKIQEIEEGFVPFSGGGSGILDDPYRLRTPKDLDYIRFERDAIYSLDGDIDCEETEAWGQKQGTVGYEPIEFFTGIIFGNGHKIKNLYVKNGQFPIEVAPCGLLVDLEVEVKTVQCHKIGSGLVPNLFGK